MSIDKSPKQMVWTVVIILLSIGGITLLSVNTSFLYPQCYLELNGSDAIAHLVAAKHLAMDGLLPYKDLYTTGGLTPYLLMAASYLLGRETGILILQILCMILSLLLLSDMVKQLNLIPRTAAILIYLFLCLASYSTGASSLEFIMPCMVYAVWYVMTAPVKAENPSGIAWRDLLLVIVTVLSLYSHLACGLIAIAAWICGYNAKNHTRKCTLTLLGLFLLLILLISIALYATGMLKPWLAMFEEYYLPVCKSQFYIDTLFVHRMVKMIPSLLLLFASFLSIRQNKKQSIFLMISWLMIVFYLLSAEEAWFRYGIMAAFLPASFAIIWTSVKERSGLIRLAPVCFLVLLLYLVPCKYMAANYISSCIQGKYKREVEGISSWNEKDYSDEMLCLDCSSKYYLILDKVPANRYYTKQSRIAENNEAIATYLYNYLWNDEFKGNLLLYHSSDGWCPESINHYRWTTVVIYTENLAEYLWSDEIIEDEHEEMESEDTDSEDAESEDTDDSEDMESEDTDDSEDTESEGTDDSDNTESENGESEDDSDSWQGL